jgi:hypothetical protein
VDKLPLQLERLVLKSARADMVKYTVALTFEIRLSAQVLEVKDVLSWLAASEHFVSLCIEDAQLQMPLVA